MRVGREADDRAADLWDISIIEQKRGSYFAARSHGAKLSGEYVGASLQQGPETHLLKYTL